MTSLAVAAGGCALLKGPAPLPPFPDQHVVLAVITWNVHAGRGDLPRLIDDLTQGRLIGKPVRNYVILLQENIARSQFDAVSVGRARQLWTYFEPVRETSRGTSGNAMLTTEMPIEARTIVLPRIRRVRKAVAASFEIEGVPLFVVNAHLENRVSWLKGAVGSDTARRRQADALVSELPPGFGIVGGDLNTWLGPDEPAWQALRRRFDDTPMAGVDHATFGGRLPLDHLFFDLPPGWEAIRRVIADPYNSDHHPVLGLVVANGRSS